MRVVMMSAVMWVGVLVGCTVMQPTAQRSFVVEDAPPVAFQKALKATGAVHATILQQDAALGMINATLAHKIALMVVIRPQGSGSVIEVAHQRAPDFLPVAPITVAQDWVVAYGQQ
jgi:hypothetical protein